MSKVLSILSGIVVIVLLVILGGTLISLADSSTQVDAGPRASVGSAFTYQGYLADGPNPASGRYDFTFELYDDPDAGNQVGPTVPEVVTVTQGLFAVELDFGSVFDGTGLWLQIGVRPDGDTDPHTTLLPRQRLTAAPLATYAGNAPWSGLSGVPAGFADGIDDDTLYQAGTGLDLVDTTLGITLTYQLPQECDADQFIRWTGTGWTCTEAGTGIVGWSLSGNSGTTPGADFLGTTDDTALQLHVNSSRALRLEPDATSPNLVGGYEFNDVGTGLSGATIGGGGRDLAINRVSANFGTVGGGAGNSASGYASTVGGGEGSSAGGNYGVIGGGAANTADGDRATVGGGSNNAADWDYATVSGGSGNTADAAVSTIGGGAGNVISGAYGAVAGGLQNEAGGLAAAIGGGESNTTDTDYAAIGGGYYNQVSAAYGTIGGGGPSEPANPTTSNNRVYDEYGAIGGGGGNIAGNDDGDPASQSYATVAGGLANAARDSYATAGGGTGNIASGYASTVGGGDNNRAENNYATVTGGQSNLAGTRHSTVGGGQGNEVTGLYGTIPGGLQNAVAGSLGFAAGLQAHADHNGAFVWSDSTGAFASTGPDQFLIDASGGVGIGTNTPSHTLTVEGSAAIQSSNVLSVSVIYADGKALQAPRALYAVGDLLYVTAYATNTLSIWNVLDPPSHTRIGYTTFQIQGPIDLQVVGDRAYVASQNRDMLTILDISDPADPSHVGDTTEYLDYPQGVHVSGKYAYVASLGYGGNYDGLTIFDVTDAPAEIAATSFITTYLQGTSDVFVVDNHAYVTSRLNSRLVVFDVSDPRQPLPVSYTEEALSQPVRVYISGIHAYVVDEGANAVVVYDVSNPAQIVHLGQFTTDLSHPRSIYVSGDRAYVAYAGDAATSEHCGLTVLDISDPADIVELNMIDMSNWRNAALVPPKPVAVAGSGDRIYVANEQHDSVTIFEIDGLEAAAVRAGEMQAAQLEVSDYAAIEGDLSVRGGLNVGSGGALIQGTLSVESPADSYIQGRLGIGPVATVITRSVSPGEFEEIILRQPTHQLDVDGEARFRVNGSNHLVLRSNNTGSDEDAYIDFVDFAYPDLYTASARIEFGAADPLTHTTSIHFHTQGPDDPTMISRMQISPEGNLLPDSTDTYLLGSETSRWLRVHALEGVVTTSDGRYKDDVQDLPYGLESVMSLRPVAFGWTGRPEDGRHFGLIAQEVREVIPEVVSVPAGERGTLGMNYSELVPVLITAVQEQQAEIESQAEQIAGLEARLEALELGKTGWANRPSALNLLGVFGFGGLVLGAVSLGRARRMGGRS